MKKVLLLLILPTLASAFDSFESERYLYAYMRFTKEVKRLATAIPLNENEPRIIQDLKFELKSCGVSSTVNSCLDSKFKSVRALESFSNENLEGSRFLIKGFSKDFMDQSLIIQVMTIHAEFEEVQVDKVEFFKETIPLTEDGFKLFFDRYKKNETTKIFEANEFFPHQITHYMDVAKNSENPLEVFHAISLAKSLDLDQAQSEEILNILRDRFELILTTKSPLYQIEFLILFEGMDDLKKDLALKFIKSSDKVVQEKSAVSLAKLGVNNPQVKELTISALKTSVNYHDQLDALDGLFKIKSNLEDDILILQMIKSGNAEVSKKAYGLSLLLNFSKDHLPYLTGELKNPISEYKIFILEFLSKIDSAESTKIILESLDDISEPVSKKAFTILKNRKLDSADFERMKKHLKTLKEHTRFYILQLLDLDKREEISFIILDQATSILPKVKGLAIQLLFSREITPKLKDSLYKMVRRKKTKTPALQVLSKLETPEITDLLINELDSIDSDDLSGFYEIIKKRELSLSNYNTLKGHCQNKEPRLRGFSAKLIMKFPTKETLDFLKSLKEKESENSVRAILDTLIKYLDNQLFPKPPVEPTDPTTTETTVLPAVN